MPTMTSRRGTECDRVNTSASLPDTGRADPNEVLLSLGSTSVFNTFQTESEARLQ